MQYHKIKTTVEIMEQRKVQSVRDQLQCYKLQVTTTGSKNMSLWWFSHLTFLNNSQKRCLWCAAHNVWTYIVWKTDCVPHHWFCVLDISWLREVQRKLIDYMQISSADVQKCWTSFCHKFHLCTVSNFLIYIFGNVPIPLLHMCRSFVI